MGWLAFQKSQLKRGSGYGMSQVRVLTASHQETVASVVHSTYQHTEKGHMVGGSSLTLSFDVRKVGVKYRVPLGKALPLSGPYSPGGSVCMIPSPPYAPSLFKPGVTEFLGDCPVQYTGFAEGRQRPREGRALFWWFF